MTSVVLYLPANPKQKFVFPMIEVSVNTNHNDKKCSCHTGIKFAQYDCVGGEEAFNKLSMLCDADETEDKDSFCNMYEKLIVPMIGESAELEYKFLFEAMLPKIKRLITQAMEQIREEPGIHCAYFLVYKDDCKDSIEKLQKMMRVKENLEVKLYEEAIEMDKELGEIAKELDLDDGTPGIGETEIPDDY